MARKKTVPSEKVQTVLIVPLDEARDRVSRQIDKGNELLATQITNLEQLRQARDHYYNWSDFTEELLKQIFNAEEPAKEFSSYVGGFVAFGGPPPTLGQEIGDLQDDLHFKLRHLTSIYERLELFRVEVTGGQEAPNSIEMMEHIIQRFHRVARQLRKRYNNRGTLDVADEYDVQDLLHALLRLFFDDIRAEEWTPSYAGRTSRMDFLLKSEQVVIEAKKTRKDLGAKQIGDELLIDIGRYKSHPDCRTLICFIYDPDGYIGNPASLESDLGGLVNGLTVRVIIAPK